jgi:hypothetical protein
MSGESSPQMDAGLTSSGGHQTVVQLQTNVLRGPVEQELVAHTGLEPVISALRGQRVNQLHQCAVEQQLIIDGQCEAWQTTEIKRFGNCF